VEEKYIEVQRESHSAPAGGRRVAPPQKRPKQNKSIGKKVLWGLYNTLAVLSLLVVVVYAGFSLMVKPPEQAEVPSQPPQTEQTTPGTETPGEIVELPPEEIPPEPLIRRENVYTVLLAATDLEGIRTDTMMVATFDIPNKKVGIVSVPRDTLTDREKGKNPKLVYGSGNVKQRREDISNMLGIPIDYYVKVNISGFIALVDYLEGVDFYVPCDMDYDDPEQDLAIHYTEGMQHLDGKACMEVARFRKNNDGTGYSDVGRTETQRKLILALAKKVLSWDSLTKVNGFVEIFKKNVSTDLSLNDMLYFASQAVKVDLGTGVETATLPGRGDAKYMGYKYCYELDHEKSLEIINSLINPYDREMTLEDMNLVKAQGYMT